jgi:seryl-tRNA synthetase
MLDIKVIREQADLVRTSIARRHLDPTRVDLDRLLALDGQWRTLQGHTDENRGKRNELSSSIKGLAGAEREAAVQRVKALKGELAELERQLETTAAERDALLRLMPNLLDPKTPVGRTDEENVEVSRWGEPRALSFKPRDHVELGRLTDTIDFDRAAKVTGSNFYYLKNEAALLEVALSAYAAGRLVPKGFVPISTPDIARDAILEGIGFAPRGPETQIYSLEGTDLSLVGTAEITVGGYHSGEILAAGDLPRRYLGFSHCFRTEAGAYGKESRGLYRVHQFSKAEMFVLCTPETSEAEHDRILACEEELFQGLGIPYRVVRVCSGELGAPAASKYDIEAWMPGRGAYGEVTSCSNCTDYQARRLGIRYRPEAGASPRFVHMLNGTALAVSRTLIALFENHQEEDGSIRIPEALQPFLPGLKTIPARG